MITSTARGISQQAYQVRVATTQPDLLSTRNLTWDSGVVRSARSFDVPYGGPPLQSRTRYYWEVRVWDNYGNVSAWSEPTWFETAFLSPGEFRGAWIRSPKSSLSLDGAYWIWYPEGNPAQSAPVATRYFRRTIDLSGQPTGAQFLLTADDQFVLYVNGQEVAHSSGQPDAWRQAMQVDLTRIFILAPTRSPCRPRIREDRGSWIGKLHLDFADGAATDVVTDQQWKASTDGPQGWEQPGFDDSAWVQAMEVAAYGGGPWDNSVSVPIPEPLLRKQFSLNGGIESARVYMSALGYGYLYVNGQRVSNHVLDTAFTNTTRPSTTRPMTSRPSCSPAQT